MPRGRSKHRGDDDKPLSHRIHEGSYAFGGLTFSEMKEKRQSAKRSKKHVGEARGLIPTHDEGGVEYEEEEVEMAMVGGKKETKKAKGRKRTDADDETEDARGNCCSFMAGDTRNHRIFGGLVIIMVTWAAAAQAVIFSVERQTGELVHDSIWIRHLPILIGGGFFTAGLIYALINKTGSSTRGLATKILILLTTASAIVAGVLWYYYIIHEHPNKTAEMCAYGFAVAAFVIGGTLAAFSGLVYEALFA